jgi:hypothetical protein
LALELVEWPSPVQPPLIVAAAEAGNARSSTTMAAPNADRRILGMDIVEIVILDTPSSIPLIAL